MRFRVPNVEIELSPGEAEELVGEFRLLNASLPELAAGKTVVDVAALTGEELLALARALDHLRQSGAEGELLRLRDVVLWFAGLERVIYMLVDPGEQRRGLFYSYSGPYEPGDRLVASATVFQVLERRSDTEQEELVVRELRG